jgi:hypothetical protein
MNQQKIPDKKCEYCLDTGFMQVRQPRGGLKPEPCVWCDAHKNPPSGASNGANPTKSDNQQTQ